MKIDKVSKRSDLQHNSGVYMLISKKNGYVYIGGTEDFKRRKREHFKDLRGRGHKNPNLQKHTDKYGTDCLKFVILERCPEDKIIEREQFYLDAYDSKFNIAPLAGTCVGIKHSEETRRKVSEALMGHPSANKGKKMSLEQRQKISKAHKGKRHTPEHRKKISEAKKRYWARKKDPQLTLF